MFYLHYGEKKTMNREKMIDRLRGKISEKRFEHSIGVEFTAACLAMRYGEELDRARIAGLLHDCAKGIPTKDKILKAKKHGIPISKCEQANPDMRQFHLLSFCRFPASFSPSLWPFHLPFHSPYREPSHLPYREPSHSPYCEPIFLPTFPPIAELPHSYLHILSFLHVFDKMLTFLLSSSPAKDKSSMVSVAPS